MKSRYHSPIQVMRISSTGIRLAREPRVVPQLRTEPVLRSDAAWSEIKRSVCAQRSTECFEQDAIERIGLWIVFGVPLDAKGK